MEEDHGNLKFMGLNQPLEDDSQQQQQVLILNPALHNGVAGVCYSGTRHAMLSLTTSAACSCVLDYKGIWQYTVEPVHLKMR